MQVRFPFSAILLRLLQPHYPDLRWVTYYRQRKDQGCCRGVFGSPESAVTALHRGPQAISGVVFTPQHGKRAS